MLSVGQTRAKKAGARVFCRIERSEGGKIAAMTREQDEALSKWKQLDWLQPSPHSHDPHKEEVNGDEMIARHAYFSEFRPYYASTHGCATFFAEANAKYFAPSNAKGPCIGCGTYRPLELLAFGWRARFFKRAKFSPLLFLLTLGHVRYRAEYTYVDFQTFHPVCPPCGQSLRTRRRFIEIVRYVCNAIVFLATTAAFTCIIMSGLSGFSDKSVWGMAILTALIAFLASGVGRFAKNHRFPRAVQHLPTGPFYCRFAHRATLTA